MTMFETQNAGSQQWDQFDERPTTHPLAIGSLICSLLACCPLITIFGPLLGLIAIISIGSNPMRRGKGLAVAGILIGLVTTGIWVFGAVALYRAFFVPLQEQPALIFDDAAAGDWAAVRGRMTGPAARASDAETEAFFAAVAAEFGNVQTVVLDERNDFQTVQGPDGSARMSVDYVVTTDTGSATLVVDWLIAEPGAFVMKPEGLTMMGDHGTAVEFPAMGASQVPVDADAAAEGDDAPPMGEPED